MKRLPVFACVVFFLASCTGLPSPTAPQASLVVGSISFEFPGSFFSMGARSIKDGIEVNLRNATTGKEFSIYTDKGYYWFTTNGTDVYTLESCQFSETAGSGASVIGERKIGISIPATPGKVLSMGDIRFRFLYTADSATSLVVDKPQPDYTIVVGGTSSGPESTHGASRRDYMYTVSMERQMDDQALQEELKRIAPDSPWLGREIVDVTE